MERGTDDDGTPEHYDGNWGAYIMAPYTTFAKANAENRILKSTAAKELIMEGGRVKGVKAMMADGTPVTVVCSAVWLTCLQPLSQTPSPTIRSSRGQWPRMPFFSPSCPSWMTRSHIIGHHQEQQKWSLSYNGTMRSSPWRSRPRRISAATASLSISRHTVPAIACVFLC